jgi:hypothetical protein
MGMIVIACIVTAFWSRASRRLLVGMGVFRNVPSASLFPFGFWGVFLAVLGGLSVSRFLASVNPPLFCPNVAGR